MEKKEGRTESWLKQLCGDDAQLYEVLENCLYLHPEQVISKESLETLITIAENSKSSEPKEVMRNYKRAINKLLFEAAQNENERDRYIKGLQDLASKAVKGTEKGKETEAKTKMDPFLAKQIEHYKFMSKRSNDVIKIASSYYAEKIEDHEAEKKYTRRQEERRKAELKDRREEYKESEREEARKRMGHEERKADEREEKAKKEKRKIRRKERRNAAQKDEREKQRASERRAARKRSS